MEYNAQSYYHAVSQLPQPFATILNSVPLQTAEITTEVRLRSNRPITLSTTNGIYFVTTSSSVLTQPNSQLLCTSHTEIENCFHALCAYSVHSFQQYIADGFIPLTGGHRAGICGTAVCVNNKIETIKNITSINIRVARTSQLVCDTYIKDILRNSKNGVIVAGEPASGKTTVLRGIINELSEQKNKVCVIDERFELAPIEAGGFSCKMPVNCDVMSGYPKHIGMMQAIRSLAPDVILCDEIGSFEDAQAIEKAANAGVRIIATIHGSCIKTLKMRPQVNAVLKTGAFETVLFLKDKTKPGQLREVVNIATDF